MLLYSQRDARWANHALGWGPNDGTIGLYGCLDTCYAMIAADSFSDMQYTPATIDEVFTNSKVFVKDSTGTFDLLPDNAMEAVWPARFSHATVGGFPVAQIAAAVKSPDTYAILFISTASVPTHFVIAYSADGKYIADPWTGKVGTLEGYGGPTAVKEVMFIKKLPLVKPAPAPTPAPIPAPIPVKPPVVIPSPLPTPPQPQHIAEQDVLAALQMFLILFFKRLLGQTK